jgi:hypothetical protein
MVFYKIKQALCGTKIKSKTTADYLHIYKESPSGRCDVVAFIFHGQHIQVQQIT